MTDPVRVFLAAPFVQFLAGDRVVDPWRRRLGRLRERLLAGGAAVFNAHHNEGWGADGLPPDQCVPSDLRGVIACDAVCAYAGDPVSAGVAVELGWASVLRKPIVLAVDTGARLTPMLQGLGSVTRVETVRLADGLDDEAIEEMAAAALRLATEARTWAPPLWPGARLDAPLGYVARDDETSESAHPEIPLGEIPA
ncbi:hypothetical protein LX15_001106 [Streptoalloteichus tenebrarius]|uniref:Nucleoside 2-deoxyribosyltransferase n=1 Tax=Streptoalloteichus tenebrarius (strain ATCC 17920 / DSM 40477 / JCM 4838 / CBS 697.72 / NBRC 16177 / NCIMB 11028 / NRRL B-12390 / A12253. 1 / ISP 5477) TaxID=1933 RepID=A0ABT1HPH5_STRSD|nr:nucleoside 2-deoxyribosyltransferase [Streptoalloteichus tenebrarius]MCP2257421.1 hypothetical protein [Streptoalloteichus tenebrarius]